MNQPKLQYVVRSDGNPTLFPEGAVTTPSISNYFEGISATNDNHPTGSTTDFNQSIRQGDFSSMGTFTNINSSNISYYLGVQPEIPFDGPSQQPFNDGSYPCYDMGSLSYVSAPVQNQPQHLSKKIKTGNHEAKPLSSQQLYIIASKGKNSSEPLYIPAAHSRKNTAPSSYKDEWRYDKTLVETPPVNEEQPQELREQSIDDLNRAKKIQEYNKCSKKELIQKLVQLEEETKRASSLPENPQDTNKVESDHTCRWADCTELFVSLDQLTDHIKKQHIGSGKHVYYCNWEHCTRGKISFSKRHKMHNHMRTHTGEKPFECEVQGCGKKFSRPDARKTHIKTHSNVPSFPCLVDGCLKAYYHARTLKKHSRTHETPPLHDGSSSAINNSSKGKSRNNNTNQHPHIRPPKRGREEEQPYALNFDVSSSTPLHHQSSSNKYPANNQQFDDFLFVHESKY